MKTSEQTTRSFDHCSLLSILTRLKRHTTYWLSVTLLILAGTFTMPSMTYAAEVLQPGGFKDDFTFGGQRIKRRAVEFISCGFPRPFDFSCTRNIRGTLRGDSRVELTPPTMKLEARVRNATAPLRREATAIGKLSTNFCVEGDIMGACGGPDNETTTATVFYEVAWLGRIRTFLPGTKASFKLDVLIRDLKTEEAVAFTTLENATSGDDLLGGFTTIGKIPVPVPQIESAGQSEVKAFVVQLRRGRTYSFEVVATAKASHSKVLALTEAGSNFFDSFQIGDAQDGVEIVSFSIDVATDTSQDISSLKIQVDSLQQTVGKLGDQISINEEEFDSRLSASATEIDGLNERIASLEENLIELREELIDGQADLHAEISTLQQQVQTLINQLTEVSRNLEGHTHSYLTGKGNGHNNTPATSGPATFPDAP